jgi:hypothetical protein
MWLLIDDVRDLNCEVIARTPEAARRALFAGPWDCVCFDHDLGFAVTETGYDILVWALDRGLLPARVQLVTSNPVGRENMAKALLADGYKTNDNFNYTRA